MDQVRANQMMQELAGTGCSGWKVLELIGNGKSALVCKAVRGEQVAALKVFDPELVERLGKDQQLERIKRELKLIGHTAPSLVEILDGGECLGTGHLFIAMEYIQAPNLATVLADIPRNAIRLIIQQIASAAKFLEEFGDGYAHRDIKPANIVITRDFQQAVLLDLGVLRPILDGSLTDQSHSRDFLGTLQYSSPEFLVRQEVDSVDGWRAVTFYQLGAVLHDLIMQRPLFDDITPYANLCKAVQTEIPIIVSDDVDREISMLAKDCLVKDPKVRIQLVTWDRFLSTHEPLSAAAAAKERVEGRKRAQELQVHSVPDMKDTTEHLHASVEHAVMEGIEKAIRRHATAPDFPPILLRRYEIAEGHPGIRISFDRSTSHGLSSPLHIYVNVSFLGHEEQVVQVDAAAYVSVADPAPDTPESKPRKELCSGVYNQEHMSVTLKNLFYLALDAAQQYGEESIEPVWLSLNGGNGTGE